MHFAVLKMATDKSDSKPETVLARTLSLFQTISQQLDLLINISEKILETQKEFLQGIGSRSGDGIPPDPLSLLALPLSLRKTVMALYKLQRATAEDLGSETKRLRGIESAAANQLVRMGYLKKIRQGRKVYFYIEPSMEMTK
jgi:hypothetical protein